MRLLNKQRTIVYVLVNALSVATGAFVTVILEASPVGVAIGTGMIATGACGLVALGWILHAANEESIAQQQTLAARQMGLVACFDKRSIAIGAEYQKRLARAKSSIDVLGFGLASMLQGLGPEFAGWARRADVRILLIHPGPYADQRDAEERSPIGTISAEVWDFLQSTRNLWSNPDIPFDVRLYTTLPSINMFRIDNEILWGPYLVDSAARISGLKSRDLPTMVVDASGTLFNRLTQHFDALWNDKDKSVSAEEVLKLPK